MEEKRHSLAHILAIAVLDLYPEAYLGTGPAIEDGFYYDFDNIDLGEKDLDRIEKKMREIMEKGVEFKEEKISRKEAEKIFSNQPYKLEIIKELEGSQITIYRSDKFVDICQGPHVKNSKEINSEGFRLDRVAGAYFKGSQENPMLKRIYGLAFSSKKELEDYLNKREEAEKRDHRALGKRMKLFHISEEVGPGLILWQPRGALLKKMTEDFALREYLRHGYKLVSSPHIAKKKLWDISGHNEYYKEDMFPLMHMEEKGEEEKDDYQLKPMNCPFHIDIYKKETRSYRDLPLKLTELGVVYRYERSGTLHGLTRVRGFTQDDAHVFCTLDQLKEELFKLIDLTFHILKSFQFKDFNIYLSTRPDKYVGKKEDWDEAEKALEEALKKSKLNYKVDPKEGTFYGPKIDIKIEDAIGREWQCTTLQVDFNLAERFDIHYIDKDGEKKKPVLIHRALMGAVERFLGVLLEYHKGELPVWITPLQAYIIPLGEKHLKEAKRLEEELIKEEIRCEVLEDDQTLSKRILKGEKEKVPYLLVIGDREMEKKKINVRFRGKSLGEMSQEELIKEIKK